MDELSKLMKLVSDELQKFRIEYGNLDLRQRVLALVSVRQSFADLGVSVLRDSGIEESGARARIKAYLIRYVRTPIAGDELAVVGGIHQYGRRIRELRKEYGYKILSGKSPDPESGVNLAPDQYMLATPEPDKDAARRWHVANRIRKGPGGTQEKLLAYLQENLQRVVTTEELAYVADNARAYGRRVRELRRQKGYPIATRFTGRPDLNVGEYVLLSTERVAEEHDRGIPPDVQRQVYARDENRCRACGWSLSDWTSEDPRILELHHVIHHQHGGKNDVENLVVLCSKCHDSVHAGNLDSPIN